MAERSSRRRAPLYGVSAAIMARCSPRGLTQRDLGGILGFRSGSGINDRLHGRRSWRVDELGAIAQELGCTVGDLYAEGERYPTAEHPPEGHPPEADPSERANRSSAAGEQPSAHITV